MKVGQFHYKQQTGLATLFTAETEEEKAMLNNLRTLIENEEGVLSRKSFSFEDGTMSIDIDKKVVRTKKPSTDNATTTASANTGNKGNKGKQKGTDTTK